MNHTIEIANTPAAQPAFCTSSVYLLSVLSALSITLVGCAAGPAGTVGADAFLDGITPMVFSGSRAAAEAAQCFEERAKFLPLSEFSRDDTSGQFTYRLRFMDQWFEQVRIAPSAGGSQAQARISPALDAKWQAQFERDRMGPLRACLGS